MKNMGRKIVDALILSIPLLVMVILAVVTWWLVLITPEVSVLIKVKGLENRPDLLVNDFRVERFDESGALRSNLNGTVAERYSLSNEIVIFDVDLMTTEATQAEDKAQPLLGTPEVNFFKITAVADKGVIYNEASVIELLDNAYVTRQPYELTGNTEKLEFRGDELKILMSEQKMLSNLPVDITQEGTRFRANGMVYDYQSNTMEMSGRVIGERVDFSVQ